VSRAILGVVAQGKLLPMPERVPFRLTRDCCDGLGVTGVQGAFLRSCEVTLSVLRGASHALVTLLSVILDDPLYRWNVDASKCARGRGGGVGGVCAAAVRRVSLSCAEPVGCRRMARAVTLRLWTG
jgi:phosphatidylinositol kinase/protein kinase (PI-3  family)